MATLRYKGDYGSSKALNTGRTASLAAEDSVPSYSITVLSAYARIYVSTTKRPYTYHYHVVTNGGYTGDLDYQFAEVDSPVYVNVPIAVTAQDSSFPIKSIDTITVTETGGHGDSTRIRGTVRIFIEYAFVGAPTPPSNIKVNGSASANVQAGTTAVLSWKAGSPGSYDTFHNYLIYRYNVETAQREYIGTTTETSINITAPYTDSKYYYYYVSIVCTYEQAEASQYASIYTFIPLTVPVFLNGGSHRLYNPRPMILVTLGDGPNEELLTLVASGWTPSRRGLPGEKIYLRKNAAYQGTAQETVTVTETDELVRSVSASLAIDYRPAQYTDAAIEAGTTIVKAAHITELQEILADIRTAYGLTAWAFTACIQGVTSLGLWTTHITEIQNCIKDIQSFINAWDPDSISYALILPAMLTSYGPSAAVLTQLRQIISLL